MVAKGGELPLIKQEASNRYVHSYIKLAQSLSSKIAVAAFFEPTSLLPFFLSYLPTPSSAAGSWQLGEPVSTLVSILNTPATKTDLQFIYPYVRAVWMPSNKLGQT